jgi:hypothetical protein
MSPDPAAAPAGPTSTEGHLLDSVEIVLNQQTIKADYPAEEINGKSIFRSEQFRSLVDGCD